ncbi:hypothetical protein AB0C96_37680 [Streptomyces sp. NPDC048506]
MSGDETTGWRVHRWRRATTTFDNGPKSVDFATNSVANRRDKRSW